MGRAILSVLAGYAGMVAVVMAVLTGAYLAMGADRAFAPGTYEVTGAWIAVWGVTSAGAGVLGGVVCARISRSGRAVLALAGLLLVLGVGNAAFRLTSETPAPEVRVRSGEVTNLEAMNQAQAPAWMYLSEPLVGMLAVLMGGRLAGCGCVRARSGRSE